MNNTKIVNAKNLHDLTVSFANKWQDNDITTNEYVKVTGQLLDMAVSLDCEKEYENIDSQYKHAKSKEGNKQ